MAMTIGTKIKFLRKQLGMSVDDLANKLGKNRATIYRYEKGDIGNLPLDVLEPLATALETTPAYLMGWEDDSNKDTATVGELLKMMRTQRNLSIEEYSKEIGIPANDLRMYESGEKYIPLSVIRTFAEYYRLSMESVKVDNSAILVKDNVRLRRLKTWTENFGHLELTDEEHDKIVEYTNFLIYIRENKRGGDAN